MSPDIRSVLEGAAGPVHEIPSFDDIYKRARHITWKRRALTAGATLLVAAAVAALATNVPFSDEIGRLPPAERPDPGAGQPVIEGSLLPGRYHTVEFQPRITFEVGRGWFVEADRPGRLTFLRGGVSRLDSSRGPDRHVSIIKLDSVVDPASGRGRPAPADMVEWLQQHPYLRILGIDSTRVLAAPATAVDAELSRAPQDGRLLTNCLPLQVEYDECFALLGPAAATPISLPPGQRTRLIFLDVGGRRLAIAIDAPRRNFDDFTQDVNRLLAKMIV